MTETEFITNIISSSKDDKDIPFYMKYPTPIYNREILHRTYAGLLNNYDFSMEYKSLAEAATGVTAGFRFDNKIKK